MAVYSSSIDYEHKIASSPNYQYTKILQNQGGTGVPIAQLATTTSYFDLPPNQVYNLARSFLRFNITTNNNGQAFSTKKLTKVPPIKRLALITRANKALVDIPNVQQYWMLQKNCVTSIEEFETYPPVSNSATAAASAQRGLCLFNNPSLNTTNADGKGFTTPDPVGLVPTAAKIAAASNNAESLVDLTGQRKSGVSESEYIGDAKGGAAASVMGCEFRLGKCGFTFFNVDKDFFSVEALQLLIEWEAYDNFAFAAIEEKDLIGQQSLATAPIATAPILDNLGFYLAVEVNDNVRNTLIAQVGTKGLSMTIPYTNVYQQDLGATTSAAAIFRINRSHGKRLLRIVSGESNTVYADKWANRALFANLINPRVTQYTTYLNSRRLQNEDLVVANGDGYKYNARLLRHSILRNVSEYYQNCPLHIDDFSACSTLDEAPIKDLWDCGIDLSTEQLWTKQYAKNALSTMLTALFICQKTLFSGPMGVDIS